jgi:hypothetical protein
VYPSLFVCLFHGESASTGTTVPLQFSVEIPPPTGCYEQLLGGLDRKAGV